MYLWQTGSGGAFEAGAVRIGAKDGWSCADETPETNSTEPPASAAEGRAAARFRR
jgi:hypothetical protein